MSPSIDDRALRALRLGVLGGVAGLGFGTAFVAGVFAFDIGSLPALWSRTGGVPPGELGMLAVTFGLVGLVAGPAFGRGPGRDPSA